MNHDHKASAEGASEEAEWLQCLLTWATASHKPEDTKRFLLGRYTINEASLLLALSLGETGAFESQVRDYMLAAVAQSELRLRDEVTGLFVGEKHQGKAWGVVTMHDVNAWLERNAVEYRWEDPPVSRRGSEAADEGQPWGLESAQRPPVADLQQPVPPDRVGNHAAESSQVVAVAPLPLVSAGAARPAGAGLVVPTASGRASITTDDMATMRKMRRQGMTDQAIGKHFGGRSRTWVSKMIGSRQSGKDGQPKLGHHRLK